MAKALESLGEIRLSKNVIDPTENTLTKSDTSRLERYRKHFLSLMELAKGMKQRISRQYNRSHNTGGPIWSDRMQIYPLPSRAHDMTEVAAFILAPPRIQGFPDFDGWPGSYLAANDDEHLAVSGLKRIFRNRCSSKQNLKTLLERSAEIVGTAQNDFTKGKTRGPKPEWRSNCEASEYLDRRVSRDDPANRHHLAHGCKKLADQ